MARSLGRSGELEEGQVLAAARYQVDEVGREELTSLLGADHYNCGARTAG